MLVARATRTRHSRVPTNSQALLALVLSFRACCARSPKNTLQIRICHMPYCVQIGRADTLFPCREKRGLFGNSISGSSTMARRAASAAPGAPHPMIAAPPSLRRAAAAT